jgi:TPP-dependent pyruvate/acetoin dehydrogenase alpha subunit
MMIKSKEKTPAPAAKNGFSLISNEKLLELYSAMLKCRMIEERVRILFKQNTFTGNYDSPVGQEAAAVGVAIDLLPEDNIVPLSRDFIPCFIKGLPLEKLFARLFNVIPPPSTIAAQLNITTSVALVNKTKKNNKIAVAFSSRGSTPLSFWHEALNSAGVHTLPIIFVSQNILSPESVTPNPQTKTKHLPLKTKAYSFPSITVDGNDVVAVYRVASEAIAHARKGNGPTLIECKRWKANDPMLNMEKYLIRKGLFSEEFKRQVAAGFSKELDAAIKIAEKFPSRKASSLPLTY